MRPVIGLTASSILPEGTGTSERFGLTANYCRAVALAGGVPLIIPGLGDAEAVQAILSLLDGLLLTGGPDVHPARFGQEIHPGCERIDEARDITELALVGATLHTDMPIFGICRGIQLLNVALGGTLIQDIDQQRPGSLDHRASMGRAAWPAHDIHVSAGSLLASLVECDALPANSLHHQAVDTVAPGLTVSARSEDGVVEALEAHDHPFLLAVQCHPEHLYQQDGRWLAVFGAFVEAAARRPARHARSA